MDQWRGLELFQFCWRRARCRYYTRIQVNSKFWLYSPDLNHHDDDDDSGYCVFMHRHGDVSFDLKCFLKLEVNCKITRLDFGKWHVAATTLLTFVRWGDQTSTNDDLDYNQQSPTWWNDLDWVDICRRQELATQNRHQLQHLHQDMTQGCAYHVCLCCKNEFCFGFSNYSSNVSFITSNSHSRCQDDYYWSYNPQNRHCYRVCKKNF